MPSVGSIPVQGTAPVSIPVYQSDISDIDTGAVLRQLSYIGVVLAAWWGAVMLGATVTAVLRKGRCPIRPCCRLNCRTCVCCCVCCLAHMALLYILFHPAWAKHTRAIERHAQQAQTYAEFVSVKERLSTLTCANDCPAGYRIEAKLACNGCRTSLYDYRTPGDEETREAAAAAMERRPGTATTIALIVPYRNRELQLQNFTDWLFRHLLLSQPQSPAGGQRWLVYVMEQDDDLNFNKGFLVNAGLQLLQKNEPQLFADDARDHANQQSPQTCIVQHDVDFLPVGPVDYSSCEWPRQLSAEIACSRSVYHAPNAYGLFPYNR